MAGLPLAVLTVAGNFLLNTYLIIEPEWGCTTGDEVPQFGHNCSLFHSCPGELSYQAEFHSITEEFGLLCERSYLTPFILSISGLPTFAGLLFWGPLSDSLGRKGAALFSSLIFIFCSLGSAFATSWQTFTAFRLPWGFAYAGAHYVYIVWVMEFTDQTYGLLINTLIHWHFSYILVAGLGYATRHWQSYLLVLNALCAPILLLYAFFFTESPRWLIRKGRLEEALKALRYIWSWNHWRRGPSEFPLTLADLKAAAAEGQEPSQTRASGFNFNFCALFARERAVTTCALGVRNLEVVAGTPRRMSWVSADVPDGFHSIGNRDPRRGEFGWWCLSG